MWLCIRTTQRQSIKSFLNQDCCVLCRVSNKWLGITIWYFLQKHVFIAIRKPHRGSWGIYRWTDFLKFGRLDRGLDKVLEINLQVPRRRRGLMGHITYMKCSRLVWVAQAPRCEKPLFRNCQVVKYGLELCLQLLENSLIGISCHGRCQLLLAPK